MDMSPEDAARVGPYALPRTAPRQEAPRKRPRFVFNCKADAEQTVRVHSPPRSWDAPSGGPWLIVAHQDADSGPVQDFLQRFFVDRQRRSVR